MRRRYVTVLVSIGIFACVVLIGVEWHERNQAMAYQKLISGNVDLLRVEFSGQQRSIKIEDRSVLRDFEMAFKNNKTNQSRSGIAYEAVGIRFNLHHWLGPQRFGGTSAGWNLIAIPGSLNAYMNGAASTAWAENLLRTGIISSPFIGAGGGGLLGYLNEHCCKCEK